MSTASCLLVTGAGGQLGRALAHRVERMEDMAGRRFLFADSSVLDITDTEAIETLCVSERVTHLINCAAYTAVDQAEEEPKLADAVNHLAVRELADLSRRLGFRLIHLSTDYVFDGCSCRPYREEDPAAPINIYGRSKLAGEEAIRRVAPAGAVILRTSWLYGREGANFVHTMLRLGRKHREVKVVADQIGTPTRAEDLAELILRLIRMGEERREVTTYHYSGEGVASWYDFAQAVFELAGLECRAMPIRTEEYPRPARRPAYAVLDKGRVRRELGIEIPHWRESLARMFREGMPQ